MNNPPFDEAGAELRASMDHEFLAAKLYTVPFVLADGSALVAENELRIDFPAFAKMNDRKGWLLFKVRELLQHSCLEAVVPLDKWVVEFSPALEELQLPSHLFMSNPEDKRLIFP